MPVACLEYIAEHCKEIEFVRLYLAANFTESSTAGIFPAAVRVERESPDLFDEHEEDSVDRAHSMALGAATALRDLVYVGTGWVASAAGFIVDALRPSSS